MKKICRNCKWWRVYDKVDDYMIGRCRNKKFVYTDWHNVCPKDGLQYWDYEGYEAGFETGEEFGCIHFETKEEK